MKITLPENIGAGCFNTVRCPLTRDTKIPVGAIRFLTKLGDVYSDSLSPRVDRTDWTFDRNDLGLDIHLPLFHQ